MWMRAMQRGRWWYVYLSGINFWSRDGWQFVWLCEFTKIERREFQHHLLESFHPISSTITHTFPWRKNSQRPPEATAAPAIFLLSNSINKKLMVVDANLSRAKRGKSGKSKCLTHQSHKIYSDFKVYQLNSFIILFFLFNSPILVDFYGKLWKF